VTASWRFISRVARPKEPDSSFRVLPGWVSPHLEEKQAADGENTSHSSSDYWICHMFWGVFLKWNITKTMGFNANMI